MIASKLKLNPDKISFLLIGTKSQWDKFKKYFPTKLLDQDVTPTDFAQNLGVEFDKDFNFKKHTSIVCRSCYYHIRDLCRLRRCLTAAVTKTIATSLSKSRNKKAAERSELLGQGCDPFSTILQCLLKSPHLLPVQFRIKYKICTLTYKIMHKCQPVYLHNHDNPFNPFHAK